jgi:hypothetical protein
MDLEQLSHEGTQVFAALQLIVIVVQTNSFVLQTIPQVQLRDRCCVHNQDHTLLKKNNKLNNNKQ